MKFSNNKIFIISKIFKPFFSGFCKALLHFLLIKTIYITCQKDMYQAQQTCRGANAKDEVQWFYQYK